MPVPDHEFPSYSLVLHRFYIEPVLYITAVAAFTIVALFEMGYNFITFLAGVSLMFPRFGFALPLPESTRHISLHGDC